MALPKGDGWYVRMDTARHVLGVFDPMQEDSIKACRICAREAYAGNEEAIAALLICDEDSVLQNFVYLEKRK